jgi:hypothetical protein
MPRLLFVCLAMSGCIAAQGPTQDSTAGSTPEETSLVEEAPIKPSNFQARVQGHTVSLSWNAISGTEKYHMQWAAVAAPHLVLGKASITTPHLKVRDLDKGRYIFQVAQETTRGPGPMETLEATIE